MKSANVKRNDGCREHKYAAEDMALNFTAAFQKDTMLNVQTKFRDRLEKYSTDKLQDRILDSFSQNAGLILACALLRPCNDASTLHGG